MLGKNAKLFFGISFGLLVVAVILAAWGFSKIVNNQVKKNVQLENSSMMFEKWRVMPMPLDFKVTFFNVTNVDEINSGEKPQLTEVGPYVYKEYRERTILSYGENDTIKYTLKKTFYFDAKASAPLSEDDYVTVINFSYMAAILTVNDMIPSMVPTMNAGFEEMYSNLTDPFYTVKVKDLLFDGLFLNCKGKSALGLICAQIAADLPPTMRPAEDGNGYYFALFSHLNRTASGPYDMVRGLKDINELGHIVAYKDSTFMNQWGSDPYCGQLNGSDASIFPPINEKNVPQRLYTFQPDICRSIYISYKEKTTIYNMTAYYYEFPESAFAAKSANPDNKCFCKKNWSANHDGCLLMGLLNLMPCQKAPAIVSMPHFYLASEELLDYFDSGIKPDKEKHNTYIYLEPMTGVVLQGVQRLQFNVELRRMDVPQLEKVPTGLFPLLWIEERAELPESIQQEIRDSHALVRYVEIARWAILAIAIISVLVSIIFLARSGAIPIWPRNNNSVTFVLRPSNGHGIDGNKG